MKPKIKPPRGYRLLGPNGMPDASRLDLYMAADGNWRLTSYCGGITVAQIHKLRAVTKETRIEAYARKIK